MLKTTESQEKKTHELGFQMLVVIFFIVSLRYSWCECVKAISKMNEWIQHAVHWIGRKPDKIPEFNIYIWKESNFFVVNEIQQKERKKNIHEQKREKVKAEGKQRTHTHTQIQQR